MLTGKICCLRLFWRHSKCVGRARPSGGGCSPLPNWSALKNALTNVVNARGNAGLEAPYRACSPDILPHELAASGL
jgi:hypothetical protein